MSDLVPPPTARIRFRRYRADDIVLVASMFADNLARRFYPTMNHPGAPSRWIDVNLDSYQSLGFGLWVVEHRETGEFLGDCGLSMQTVDGRQLVEVGYHLTAEQRGNGYATEAGRACVDFAFRNVERCDSLPSLSGQEVRRSSRAVRR